MRAAKKPKILKTKAAIFSILLTHKRRFCVKTILQNLSGHFLKIEFTVNDTIYRAKRQLYVRKSGVDTLDIYASEALGQHLIKWKRLSPKQIHALYAEIKGEIS